MDYYYIVIHDVGLCRSDQIQLLGYPTPGSGEPSPESVFQSLHLAAPDGMPHGSPAGGC